MVSRPGGCLRESRRSRFAEKPDAVLVGGDMVFNCNEIKNKNHI